MKEIEFDVTLHVKDLFAFTMRHTYCSMSGAFSLFISAVCFVTAVMGIGKYETTTLCALFVIASLFTVIQPCMLFVKCKAQVKKSENINDTLHYVLSEDGITVRQAEQEASVKWYDIRKVVQTKRGLYLYMSPVRAFIFPKEQCGSQYDTVCITVSEQVKKYKDYIPEEETEENHE